MITWWNSLNSLSQIFACIAIPSTIILLLQTILLLFSSFGGGMGTDAHGGDMHDFDSGHDFDIHHDGGHFSDHGHDVHVGHDHDHEGYDSGVRIFTVRGFIAFFCIFGWSGLVFLQGGMTSAPSISIAIVLGFTSMVLMGFIFAQFYKLQSDGTADIKSAIGVSGTVYMNIPPARSGVGKINALVSGRYAEYEAVTDDEVPIMNNEQVTVVGVSIGNTLLVIKK